MIINMKEQFQKENHSVYYMKILLTLETVSTFMVSAFFHQSRLISYLQMKANILIDEYIFLEY